MFRYVILFALVLHVSICQEMIPSEDPTELPTKPPTEAPTNAPTTNPITEAPTTKPPTEAPTTKPPTEAPTTKPPTDAPTTVTPTDEPTTDTPTDAPTTQPPTVAPTTPEPTTPAPQWKPGNWTVHGNNATCIVAVMALEFKIIYETTDGKNATAVLMVPPTANATGTCGEDNQTLLIDFPAGEGKTDAVSFVFSSSGSASKNFVISSVELSYYTDSVNFPNASNPEGKVFIDNEVNLFLTQVGKSYKCKSKIEVAMTNDQKVNATMVMEEAQIEAFRTVADAKFGAPMLCSADEFTSDIVPIAVGCALAALVVIVIIAYLIGRRRARAKGYQSM